MTAEMAVRRAVYTIESGPAAGVVAAQHLGSVHGAADLISFDMGGTTAKVGVIRGGRPDITYEFHVGGRASSGGRRAATGIPIRLPAIDLAEVGSGGGSIAWVDGAGALLVGPRSAGSNPGPACYSLGGTDATVTDADLILGYLGAVSLGGGAMALDPARAEEALARSVGVPLDVDVVTAASAVHRIVNANMGAAVHMTTVARGVDPRDFVLVSLGGAAPMHVARVAAQFGIRRVLVPPHSGVGSAMGLVATDLRTDRSLSRVVRADRADPAELEGLLGGLAADARRELGAGTEVLVERSVDVRYAGQGHELNVALAAAPLTAESLVAAAARFYGRYLDEYGIDLRDPVELVTFRVRAVRVVGAPLSPVAAARLPARPAPVAGIRPAYFPEFSGFAETRSSRPTGVPTRGSHRRAGARGGRGDDPRRAARVGRRCRGRRHHPTAARTGRRRVTGSPGRGRCGVTGSLDAEILRNAIAVAVEEASIVVVRGAYSLYILEGADAAAAVLDARGRLVGHSASTSLAHGASLRCTLPGVIAAHPLSTMEPGDVFVTNDVYRGGIHANDLILLRPVFVGPEPTYFTGTLIHVADLGGVSAGGVASSAQEIFLEGLQLPPVRVATAQGLVADVMAILAANSRQPDRLLGDVRALVAGTLVAARRIDALVERYGAAGLAAGVDQAIDYSRTRMRQEIAVFPDGVYSGSYDVDDDGIRIGRSLRVNVTVTVSGEEIAVDFEGTDAQVPASVNAGFSQVISGVMYAVRCFLDPTIPMNEGCFEVVDVRLPQRSLVNPGWPYPAGGRYVTVSAAVEAIYRALSRARPDHAVAASGLIHPFCIAGTNGAWVHNAFDYGGMGARFGKDGADATGGLFGGGRNLVPQVEAIEARVPVRIESVEVIPDSGGPGRWRGGLATRTVIRLLEDGVVDTRTDRTRHGPEVLVGGGPGRCGGFYRLTPAGERFPIGSKVTGAGHTAGDALIIETSGGGGLGPPGARPLDRLEEDLRTRRVSAAGAGGYGPDAGVPADSAAPRRPRPTPRRPRPTPTPRRPPADAPPTEQGDSA